MSISEQKDKQLKKRMEDLGLLESEIEESFVRGSGKGGQKQNKTSSCVHLLHRPSGTEVKCQKERSQALNRFFARRLLCDRIEEDRNLKKSARQQKAEKIRRQKRRRSRRSKQRMLEDKKIQGAQKVLRQPLNPGED